MPGKPYPVRVRNNPQSPVRFAWVELLLKVVWRKNNVKVMQILKKFRCRQTHVHKFKNCYGEAAYLSIEYVHRLSQSATLNLFAIFLSSLFRSPMSKRPWLVFDLASWNSAQYFRMCSHYLWFWKQRKVRASLKVRHRNTIGWFSNRTGTSFDDGKARKGLNTTSGTQFAALPLVKSVVWFARAVVNWRSRSVAKSA